MSSPNVLKLLTYCKFLYSGARLRLSSSSPLVVAEAVLRLHDAVETFQAALLMDVGAKPSDLSSFWAKVKEKRNVDLPFKAEFDAFNKVRVNFKHYAVLTDMSEMRRTAQFIPSFFSHACQQVLGLDFATVSLADLIEHVEARDLTKKAEGFIQSDQPKEAVTELAKAFCVLMAEKHGGKSSQTGLFVRLFNSEELRLPEGLLRELYGLDSRAAVDLRSFFKGIQTHIREVEELLESLGWGIDIQRYKKFRFLTPHVLRASSGIMQVVSSNPIQLTDVDATFCLEFMIDTALSVQRGRFSALDERGWSWFG